MEINEILESRYVSIYLQGIDSLFITGSTADCITYKVASPDSHIVITDYRYAPGQLARNVLAGGSEEGFALSFCQPGFVSFYENDEAVQIVIRDGDGSGTAEQLWMGVIEDGTMPAYEFNWEMFEYVGDNRIAFAVIIQEDEAKFDLLDLAPSALVTEES